MRYLFFIALFLACWAPLSAQFEIRGRVNLGTDWQPKIYLAAIDKLSDYYSTQSDMILTTAPVSPDGSFLLRGDYLPEDDRFYRLYLMKKQNTDYDACLYVGGEDHNFAHVLLQNGEELTIEADTSSLAPFGNYRSTGRAGNQLMQELSRIVYPRFYFHRIKFPTELKFSEDKLHTDLLHFADTCRNTLVALAAVNNTDFDVYFDRDADFYRRFGERLQEELPNSVYTRNYVLRMRYYANEEARLPAWVGPVIGGLLLLVALLGWLLWRGRPLTAPPREKQEEKPVQLTRKEEEILQLIGAGKSNKEIAAALFVEVSTVKTHINKVYGKLGVGNRGAARLVAQKRFSGGD